VVHLVKEDGSFHEGGNFDDHNGFDVADLATLLCARGPEESCQDARVAVFEESCESARLVVGVLGPRFAVVKVRSSAARAWI
jgi:hypothetical protein